MSTNDPYILAGVPVTQPFIIAYIGASTNLGSNAVLMTSLQLSNCLATNASAFNAAKTAAEINIANQSLTNYASWYSIYTNLPAGQVDCNTRTNSLWKMYMGALAGTNTTAQFSNACVNLMLHTYVSFIYHQQVGRYLTKLGPGLTNIYSSSADPSNGQ